MCDDPIPGGIETQTRGHPVPIRPKLSNYEYSTTPSEQLLVLVWLPGGGREGGERKKDMWL